MDNKDIWLGLKVIPKKKSIGKSIILSNEYTSKQYMEQGFLYVAHQHTEDRKYSPNTFLLTADVECVRMCGDYFHASDFVPYIEPSADAKEVNKLEWNDNLTILVYEDNTCKILDKTNEVYYTAFQIDFKEVGLSAVHYALVFFDKLENIKLQKNLDTSSKHKWETAETLISKIYNKPREEVFPPKKTSARVGFISVGIKGGNEDE